MDRGQESLVHKVTKFPAGLVLGAIVTSAAEQFTDQNIFVSVAEGLATVLVVYLINRITEPSRREEPVITNMGLFVRN